MLHAGTPIEAKMPAHHHPSYRQQQGTCVPVMVTPGQPYLASSQLTGQAGAGDHPFASFIEEQQQGACLSLQATHHILGPTGSIPAHQLVPSPATSGPSQADLSARISGPAAPPAGDEDQLYALLRTKIDNCLGQLR
jgi:hypothetical protein